MKHLPKAGCELCGGEGYVRNPEDIAQMQFCDCVLRNNALEYLGTHRNANLIKSVPLDLMERRNVLIDNTTLTVFKTFIKSFLISTGMKYSHSTFVTKDIVQAFFGDKEGTCTMQDLLTPDILCVCLGDDFNNKAYFEIFSTLVTKRMLLEKWTWIFSKHNAGSFEFKEKYSKELSAFLTSKENDACFSRIKMGESASKEAPVVSPVGVATPGTPEVDK